MMNPQMPCLPGRRKRRLLVSLIALVLEACASEAPPPTVESVIEQVSPGVVTIADRQGPIASGFAVAPGGWLITNHHVLDSGPVYLLDADGNRHQLERVADDRKDDLALLKADDVSPPVLPLLTEPPRVGETVIALGNPFGLGITVTTGVVSALPQAIDKSRLLQTDAAVNPGNAGGPLVDRQGRVVGIITSRGPVGSGVGFVVPADRIAALMRSAMPGRTGS